MKKLMLFLSIAAMLAMPMTMDASAQSHRHTPRTSATIANNDTTTGVVAFSDTTSVADNNDTADIDEQFTYESHDNDINELREVMNAIGPSVILPTVIIAILFIVAPAIIIFIICYFIYKNRQQKLKLAEMAMKNGQPIPDSVLGYSTRKQGNKSGNSGQYRRTESVANHATSPSNGILASMPTDDQLWRNGVMKLFIGIGLMFLLDSIMGSLGFSIGVLVTLYGAGQAFIAWTSRRNTNAEEDPISEEPISEEPISEEPVTEKPITEEPAKEDTTETK